MIPKNRQSSRIKGDTMKNRVLTVVLASIFTLLFIYIGSGMAAKPISGNGVPNTGQIHGTITIGGDPFAGFIYIPGKSFVAKTDDQGNYTLYYVPVGSHTVMLDVFGGSPVIIGTCTVVDQQTCTRNLNLTCSPSTIQTCPLQQGVCSGKVQTCASDGMSWSICNYGTDYSSSEICGDSKDNNCNGTVDEGCLSQVCVPYTSQPCPLQQGVCFGAMHTCAPDGMSWDTCNYGPNYSTIETCDGLDNNCDGVVDQAECT